MCRARPRADLQIGMPRSESVEQRGGRHPDVAELHGRVQRHELLRDPSSAAFVDQERPVRAATIAEEQPAIDQHNLCVSPAHRIVGEHDVALGSASDQKRPFFRRHRSRRVLRSRVAVSIGGRRGDRQPGGIRPRTRREKRGDGEL